MDAYRLLIVAHVAAGVVALLTFWTAGLSRKGSPLHRAAGKIYLGAMLAVLASALVITVIFFMRGRTGVAVFLGYLCVITAVGCWTAWRAIRDKRAPAAFYGLAFRALAWAALASGVATFVAGVMLGSMLLMTFCLIGVVIGVTMLRRARDGAERAASNPRWWLREHYNVMLGNGVATHIAFFNIGLSRLLEPLGIAMPQALAWMMPVAVALIVGVRLDRKYGGGGSRSTTPKLGAPAREIAATT